MFYPGVMFMVEPQFFKDLETEKRYSWFVISIMMYASVTDTLGRYLAKIPKFADVVPKKYYLLACSSRFIFVILYMLTLMRVNEDIFG